LSDIPEPRVRDILPTLEPRPFLCQRLIDRVGRRGWERPTWGFGRKLYPRMGLADPWDPGARPGRELKLGPVSLKLGRERRQPAPHLRPKEPKKKKPVDPVAKWRRPPPKRAPSPPPAPTPQPATAAKKGPTLKGKLPVRPDVDAPAAPPKRSLPPVRPPGHVAGRRRSARVSMKPSQARSPIYRSVEKPTPVLEDRPAEPPPKPIQRSPPRGPLGLDDLFGGMSEGRVSMRKRKKKDDE